MGVTLLRCPVVLMGSDISPDDGGISVWVGSGDITSIIGSRFVDGLLATQIGASRVKMSTWEPHQPRLGTALAARQCLAQSRQPSRTTATVA